MIFTLILALFTHTVFASDYKIVDLKEIHIFYRELPKEKVQIGSEIQSFQISLDLYKLRRDQWMILFIDTGKVKGIGMVIQPDTDLKLIPKNKILKIVPGKCVQHTVDKIKKDPELDKKTKAFMAQNKLKPRGSVVYLQIPMASKNGKDPSISFRPVQ